MDAPPPLPPARVAFVHRHAVWTMDASGGDRRRVIVQAGEPAWSPDGTRLAVAARRAIITLASDGSDKRVVAHVSRGALGNPAWSPDGSRIAFVTDRLRRRGFDSAIRTVGTDGRAEKTVVAFRGRGRHAFDGIYGPRWSPDGHTLLYSRSFYARAGEVRSVRADGTHDRRLLAKAENASYSPDGARIVFGELRGTKGETCGEDECYPNADVAVAAANGTGRHVLLRTETDESDPSWSPDGTWIAFSSARNNPFSQFPPAEVYSMAADGSCLTWLTNGNRQSGAPRFSPGDPAPASCATDRPPLLEFSNRPRPASELWLGESFSGALLTSASRDSLDYEDCGAFDPSACPPPFLISTEDSCRPARLERYDVRHLRAVRVIGAAVVGHLPGNKEPLGYVDGRSVFAQLEGGDGHGLARLVFSGLRRVDGRPLGPPRLPRSLIRFLPRRLRPAVQPC